MDRPLLGEIQARVRARDYQFTFHAGERMIEQHISVAEVEQALLNGEPEVIEDYPEDIRGPSSPSEDYLNGARRSATMDRDN